MGLDMKMKKKLSEETENGTVLQARNKRRKSLMSLSQRPSTTENMPFTF
ncbi:hypothetical protein [Treponema pedis]|nr:hypothetical protein [Treponema pedis]